MWTINKSWSVLINLSVYYSSEIKKNIFTRVRLEEDRPKERGCLFYLRKNMET